MKKRIPLALQAAAGLALGLGLCIYLVRQTALTGDDRRQLLENINIQALIGVVALTFLMLWTGARKWAFLDRALDHHAPHATGYYWRHFVWQSWLAQILPSTVALIAGRALATHGGGERNWKRGFKNAMVDQLGELFIVMAFMPGSLLQLWMDISFPAWLICGLGVAVLGGAAGVKIFPRLVFPEALMWSFLRILFMTLRLLLGAMAFNLALAPAHIAYALPFATLTVLVPLTPGNLGLAEWGWVFSLMLWGDAKGVAALYALSFRVLILIMQTLALPLAFMFPKSRAG
ncbi:MAG: hypothetical protein WDO70_00430 [Alphaproteobacteria bacterium]